MSITQERKSELIREFGRSEGDTGSPEAQISVLSHRINSLTTHAKAHKKDHASRRGLLKLVSRRRSLLDYVKKNDLSRYKSIVERLGLRK